MEKLIDIEVMKNDFLALKRALNNLYENESYDNASKRFDEIYEDLIVEAMSGNPVCADFLSYLYKRGFEDKVPENYNLSMKWEIFAAAMGNTFAIEKLNIFLNSALDDIVYSENFPKIKFKLYIDEENYNFILGQYLCDSMVKSLNIDVRQLSKERSEEVLYDEKLVRPFEQALNAAKDALIDKFKP